MIVVEYRPWYQPDHPMMECQLCGALVCDTDKHSAWHRDPAQAPKAANPARTRGVW